MIPYKKGNGDYYKEKEVKLIKEYTNFILIEHPEGYRECINKQDLGLTQEIIKPKQEARHIKLSM